MAGGRQGATDVVAALLNEVGQDRRRRIVSNLAVVGERAGSLLRLAAGMQADPQAVGISGVSAGVCAFGSIVKCFQRALGYLDHVISRSGTR